MWAVCFPACLHDGFKFALLEAANHPGPPDKKVKRSGNAIGWMITSEAAKSPRASQLCMEEILRYPICLAPGGCGTVGSYSEGQGGLVSRLIMVITGLLHGL